MYAVDTVRFIIPTFYKDFLANKIGSLQSSIQYLNSERKIEKEYQKFVLFDKFRGSYEINPSYKIVSQGLLFEFSIPKWCCGTNYATFWREDLIVFFRNFQTLLEEFADIELPVFWKWILKRVDISYSFNTGGSLEVQRLLHYFSTCIVRSKHPDKIYKSKHHGFECIFWKRASDSFKFYNKKAEIEDHKESHVISDEELSNLSGVIRFEHTWRSKYIQSRLSLPSESSITFEQFDFSMQEKYCLDSHLKDLFKDFFHYHQFKSLESLLQEINEVNFGQRFSTFYKFINDVLLYGLDFVKNSTKRTTFEYRVRKFREFGVDLQLLSNFFEKRKEHCLYIDSSVFNKNYII